MTGALTADQRDTVRTLLARAKQCLKADAQQPHDLKRREQLESAHAAVTDALRWASCNDGPVFILAALESYSFGRLNVEASNAVDAVRAICRGALRSTPHRSRSH